MVEAPLVLTVTNKGRGQIGRDGLGMQAVNRSCYVSTCYDNLTDTYIGIFGTHGQQLN